MKRKHEFVMPTIHVLVVDDDKITRTFIKSVLEKMHCKVDEAKDGKEALEKFTTIKYQLVFVDYHLTDITGIELIEQFRLHELRDKFRDRTPIICLSSVVTIQNEPIFLDAGFDMAFPKPIDQKTLQEIVKIFVEHY